MSTAISLPTTGLRWKPILQDALREQADDALQAIMASIPEPTRQKRHPDLAGGDAGIALFFGYAALAHPDRPDLLARARAHLEHAVDNLHLCASKPWLFEGYTGVAWTADHFLQHGLLEDDQDDFNEEIDEALLAFLQPDPWRGLPELIMGLAGLGLYALDRRGRGQGDRITRRVLDILCQKAEQTPRGLAWFDAPELLHPFSRERYPRGLFNLGVSHGNPGVLGFLAEAARQGYTQARALLDSALEWLLSCRTPHENGSQFSAGFARDEQHDALGTRLTWCYGDLGIAAITLLAAQATANPRIEREARELIQACLDRQNPHGGILDACICHGSMGNAHILNRLYQATGMEGCRSLATACLERGLAHRRPVFESGGFLAYRPPFPEEPPRDPWIPLDGLLEGSAGVGLALLAATTEVEPAWDRHLLVHVSPRED